MGIFDRMGKVIQSNLNALLDKAEDERKLVDLNLDEMDEQIKAGHQEVVQAVAAEKQLRKKCDDLQADVERDRNDILQGAATRMQEVVKKLAEAGNYDLVVDVSNAVFFKPALEITKDATTAYDKAHPAK